MEEVSLRNERIIALAPMVTRIARNVRRRVPFYDLDDLMSEGMIGAIQAVDRWDPDAGDETPLATVPHGQGEDQAKEDRARLRGKLNSKATHLYVVEDVC